MTNIYKNLNGIWFNSIINLEIKISSLENIETFLFEYNPKLNNDGLEIENDETILMLGSPRGNVLHFNNRFGSWELVFTSKNSFVLSNENPKTGNVKKLEFQRKMIEIK